MGEQTVHAESGRAPRRRERIVVAAVAVAVLLAAGGLVGSSFIRSPEQALADSAAPPATLITADVQRRVLASTLITRGRVVADTSLDVTPVVTGAGAQVVTAVLVKQGEEVRPGRVLLAVAGRPLFTLPGAVPAYRDLKPGDSGKDIGQLQSALGQLGHYRGGDKAGYFGGATKVAVQRFYAKRGYDVPNTGGPGAVGDASALAAASQAVESAQREVEAMKRRIASGEMAGPGAEPLPQQLTFLNKRLGQAQRDRSELIARTGPMLPLSEFVFVPAYPARVAALTAKVGDRVAEPLITLSAGQLVVRAKLRPDQVASLRQGMPAALAAEALGSDVTGSVTTIGEVTVDPANAEDLGSIPAGSPYRPITIATGTGLPAQWAGQDVRVTITAARTQSAVLVVPLSAVSAGADGRTTVSVVDGSGAITVVPVRAGVSGDGFVEVAAIEGTLHEGARVVVGGAR